MARSAGVQCRWTDDSLMHPVTIDLMNSSTRNIWQQCFRHVLFSLQVYTDSLQLTCITVITGPPNGPGIVLLAVVCRRRLLSSSVTLPEGGPAVRRARGRSAAAGGHRRSGDRICTAGQYGYAR